MSDLEPLDAWIDRWLPRSAHGRTVVVGEPLPGVLDRLPTRLSIEPAPPSASEPGTAAVALAATTAEDLGGVLEAAATTLRPGGRLLLLRVDGATASTELLGRGFVPRPGSRERLGEIDAVAADWDGTVVRGYREGDQSAILELFRRCFGVERDLAHWRWKFARHPLGNHRISLAFSARGALVGQYCAYPARFARAGAVVPVHQVGDVMTAPAARGLGRGPTSVLGRTVEHFYETFCRDRVAFNYGFNTGSHQKFSLRFVGARKVEEAPLRERDLRARPPRPRRRWLGGFEVRTELDPADVDRLWRDAHPAYGALVVRDSAWLRWRYLDRPDRGTLLLGATRRRRLVGWGAFQRRGTDLVWGDLLVLPDQVEALESLLAGAVERLGDRGDADTGDDPGAAPLARAVGWFPPRPRWLDRWFDASGFERRAEPQGLALVIVPFTDRRAAERAAEDFFYTFGDSDLF